MNRTNTWKAGLTAERWDDELVVNLLKTFGRVPVTVYFGSGLFELDKFWLGSFGSRVDSEFCESGRFDLELAGSAVESGIFDSRYFHSGSLVSERLGSGLVDLVRFNSECFNLEVESELLAVVLFNSGGFNSEVKSEFFPAAKAGFDAPQG